MDALGTIKPVVSSPAPVKVAVVAPAPAQIDAAVPVSKDLESVRFDARVAEAKRQEVLANAARNAPQPLGSQVFTMFKDSSGQMVTRFRDTNSGKVTYIPEPQLLRMAANTAGSESLLNIKV